MRTINQSTKLGFVGAKPELRATTGGVPVATFSLATSERWTDDAGQDQEETTWHRCVAFGKSAEIVAKLVDKGSLVYVQGRDQKRTYADRDEVQRVAHEIVIESFSVMPGQGSASKAQAGQASAAQAPTGQPARDGQSPETGKSAKPGKAGGKRGAAKPATNGSAARASFDAMDGDIPF